MFIFSSWYGKIICISWNLSENEYEKTEVVVMGNGNHSRQWWWGGEGDKEMKMEGVNKCQKKICLIGMRESERL